SALRSNGGRRLEGFLQQMEREHSRRAATFHRRVRADAMKAKLGRALSIAGHPFILTPLAVTIATWKGTAQERLVILGLLFAAVHVVRRHRRGEVSDIDVSNREHRPAVFRVAIGSLVLVMLVLHLTG